MLANRVVVAVADVHPDLVVLRQGRESPVDSPFGAKDRRIVQNVAQEQDQDRLSSFERPQSRKELAGNAGRPKVDENQIGGVGQGGFADDALPETFLVVERQWKS